MVFRQYLHTEPVIAASYLFGCAGKARGAVIDPVGDINLYLRDAERLGLPIRYVIDTHIHADHVSGGLASLKRPSPTKSSWQDRAPDSPTWRFLMARRSSWET